MCVQPDPVPCKYGEKAEPNSWIQFTCLLCFSDLKLNGSKKGQLTSGFEHRCIRRLTNCQEW